LVRPLTPTIRAASIVAVAIVAAGIVGYLGFKYPPTYMAVHRASAGAKQPIPFSHRVHAGAKQIACAFCHSSYDQGPKAGMPPVEKCLLCHAVIVPKLKPIQDLQGYADRGEPVPWDRVYRVADYVYFSHQVHINKGFDCGNCHGNVRGMDRIQLNQRIQMAWCVNCHRQNAGSTDCLACHR
jgi:hypothetical protein